MNNNTRFITGLKALGAIMVVISHLKMQFSGYTDFSWKFINFSSYFIILFISISAFTVSMSIERKASFSFLSYMKRRWVRLAPSYYVVLVIGLLVKTAINGWMFLSANIRNVAYDVLFLNMDPINKEAQAAILGVEWMLPIMFWSYVLIPVFLFSVRRMYSLFIVFFTVSVLLHFYPDIFITYTGFGGAGWSMQFYIVMYAYTIFIYFLHSKRIDWRKLMQNRIHGIVAGFGTVICLSILLFYLKGSSERVYAVALMSITAYVLWIKIWVMNFFRRFPRVISLIVDNTDLAILGIILAKYMINFYFIKNPHIIICLWFGALLIAGFHRPLISRLLFENRIMQLLGTISFGMYLLHPLAIILAEQTIPMQYPFLRVLLIFPVTILASYFLYRIFEKPLRMRTHEGII